MLKFIYKEDIRDMIVYKTQDTVLKSKTDMTVHTKQTLVTDRMCMQKTTDVTVYKTTYWYRQYH